MAIFVNNKSTIFCQITLRIKRFEWLGSRVVSVLDSGAEGPGSDRSRDAIG